jgi:L-threonylcarbamoyladenylate synthase
MKAEIGEDIIKAKAILESGDLVAIPTETVYGLAAKALDPNAVAKIFEAKNRPSFDPLIIHVASISFFKKYAKNIPDEILEIAEKFSPGPITFLLEKQDVIPDIVTSGLPKVAIRIPNHPQTLQLLKSIDFPLAAPSANPFGYVSPTKAEHVYEQLGEKIPYILDGGQCKVGLESTIVGFEDGKLVIFRKGGLSIEELSSVFKGEIVIKDHSSSNPQAPGMLDKHYAPNKKMALFEENTSISNISKIGFLGFDKKRDTFFLENQFILSENGDLKEAAFRLFEGLRWLDKQQVDQVYIELVPETGLGVAINDRLRRAAAKA